MIPTRKKRHQIKEAARLVWKRIRHMKHVQLHGVTVSVDSPVLSPAMKRLLLLGQYEAQEIAILKKILSEADRVLEVGAGIGFLSTFSAKKVGSHSVFAYEANPRLQPTIQMNYRLNGVSPNLSNAILTNATASESQFFIEENFYASSTIQRSSTAKKVRVKTRHLNSELEQIQPTLLIVDIEGGEIDFFSEIDYGSVKKILLEVHPHIVGDIATSNLISRILNDQFTLNTKLSANNTLFFEKM